MTEVKYLSNKELVDEATKFDMKELDYSATARDIANRKEELKTEILRRLNEPWRQAKKVECKSCLSTDVKLVEVGHHCNECGYNFFSKN